jgi:hypothetical protein
LGVIVNGCRTSNKFVNAVSRRLDVNFHRRYNSGSGKFPVDIGGWAHQLEVRSWSVPIREIQSSRVAVATAGPQTYFRIPKLPITAFRSPAPGETGARNILRGMGFFTLDAGLYKSFSMPWSENHKLTIRWETFNVTNSQFLTGNADVTNGLDPQFRNPPATFYNFTSIQGTPRVMQFALRYDF